MTHAQGTDNLEIHETLGDNTLEQTYLLNIATDGRLSEIFPQQELNEMTYEFLNQGDFRNYFELSSTSGDLMTSQLVDRDVLCPQQITCVINMNVGLRSSSSFRTINVFISIDDINDNAPKFSQSSLTYNISETTVPGVITPLVPATDLDSPQNGVARYRLHDVSGLFGLDVSNGSGDSLFELRLQLRQQLDREQQGLHLLQVLAVDGGAPALTGTLSLTVNVIDINDHQPIFDQDSYEIDISENSEINQTVIQVTAFDQDFGDNGRVQYSFNVDTQRSFGDVFRIDAQSGAITLRQQLNYEHRHSYSLTVIAEDQGLNSVPSSTRVLVTVLDENDVTPAIVLNDVPTGGRIRVNENQPSGLYVGHVSVHDQDSGANGQVKCQLNYDELFALQELYEKEYKIVTVTSLDRETNPVIQLVIQCHDLGRPRLESQLEVTIEVIDADDNRPQFTVDRYIAYVQENNDVGAFVIQVTAKDDDIGVNGEVEYELLDHSQHFAIDAVTGEITALTSFDREAIDLYNVTVVAQNGGDIAQSATTTVTVHITDVDDNAPSFLAGQDWVFHVTENSPRGTLIGSVVAFDRDAAPNNNFTYQLDPLYNTEQRFSIDRIDGSIRTNKPIDRELRDVYELHIEAISAANRQIKDSVFVEVNIDDENDNAPVITFPTADTNDVTISNSVPLGYRVLRIMAYDIDDGVNAELTYHVMNVDGSEPAHFRIDSETGTLFTRKGFDDASSVNFTLQVTVSDHGVSPRSSDVILHVRVNSSYVYPGDGEPSAGGSTGSSSSGSTGGTSNLLPILLGSISGVIVVVLLSVITVLLLLRRRRSGKPPREAAGGGIKMWSQGDVADLTTSTGNLSSASDSDAPKAVPDVTLHTEPQQVCICTDVVWLMIS